MRKRLADRLAYLASEAMQIRYIVQGTKDDYLVADEVLDAALSDAGQC